MPGTVYGSSKKGWIDGKLLEMWLVRHFLVNAPPVHPILLLMGGRLSHYQPSVIWRAAEEGIIVFLLPPHTSHLNQPQDKCCVGPLKGGRNVGNPGQVVTRHQLSATFQKSMVKLHDNVQCYYWLLLQNRCTLNCLTMEGKSKTMYESLAEGQG